MSNLTLLARKNYLVTINNLPGSQLFRHVYANDENGQELDIVDGGNLSCAFVVSVVAHIFGWIDRPHVTVSSTLKALVKSGWYETTNPRSGDVVHWSANESGSEHVGFFLGDGRAISNVSAKHAPDEHDLTMPDGRKPQAFYTRNYDDIKEREGEK